MVLTTPGPVHAFGLTLPGQRGVPRRPLTLFRAQVPLLSQQGNNLPLNDTRATQRCAEPDCGCPNMGLIGVHLHPRQAGNNFRQLDNFLQDASALCDCSNVVCVGLGSCKWGSL